MSRNLAGVDTRDKFGHREDGISDRILVGVFETSTLHAATAVTEALVRTARNQCCGCRVGISARLPANPARCSPS